MRHTLRLHPDSLCAAATKIEVDIARPRPGSLILSYVVSGRISDLRLPPIVAAARVDELWRHTCFEAFVHPSADPGYYEFNFSPSTRWAAYRFDSYRSGMRVATEIDAPRIAEVGQQLERFEFRQRDGRRRDFYGRCGHRNRSARLR